MIQSIPEAEANTGAKAKAEVDLTVIFAIASIAESHTAGEIVLHMAKNARSVAKTTTLNRFAKVAIAIPIEIIAKQEGRKVKRNSMK